MGELSELKEEPKSGPSFPYRGRLTAKVRYRQADQACTVTPESDGYHVIFDEPQRAVTPGQSLVLYDGDRCLGGGVIEAALTERALAA